MITLKEAFGVLSPERPGRPTPAQRRQRDIYREWDRERSKAAAFGPHHVQEIDAIFSRALEPNE